MRSLIKSRAFPWAQAQAQGPGPGWPAWPGPFKRPLISSTYSHIPGLYRPIQAQKGLSQGWALGPGPWAQAGALGPGLGLDLRQITLDLRAFQGLFQGLGPWAQGPGAGPRPLEIGLI